MQKFFFILPVLSFALTATLYAPAQTGKVPAHMGSKRPNSPALTLPLPDPSTASTVLTEREQALQYLNRFTFGPRPGDVDRVLATGTGRWLAAQLDPDSIPDAALQKRLVDYPTLTMSPREVLTVFPDYGAVVRVADGKTPFPTDPLLLSEYQVQVYKLRLERERELHPLPEVTAAQKAARTAIDQAHATLVVRNLLALPKTERMAALNALPLEDRIAAASDDVQGGLRDRLFAGFSARERETAYAFQGWVGDAYCAFDELAQSHVLRQVLSERQMLEVMTAFWFNHFNIYQPGGPDQWYTTAFERDTIRAHALGKFRDLLLATAQSPAMLVYLDNWVSTGPHSAGNGIDPEDPDGKPKHKGLNENYGREVMELHSVGTGAGYTQEDVRQLSAMLTGWTVDHPSQAGPFHFSAKDHEPGTKTWFGYTIDEDGAILSGPAAALPLGPAVLEAIRQTDAPRGMKQGVTALALLAASPQAAHFLSFHLAQRFVADKPPAELIERMSATYLATDGDIREVLRTLATSPEFNSRAYFANKMKTPSEFAASVYRATDSNVSSAGPVVEFLTDQLGEAPYKKLDPNGYGKTADAWMNTRALRARLNFADEFTHSRFGNQRFDAAHLIPPENIGAAARPIRTSSASARHAAAGTGSDPQVALRALEVAILSGRVSPATHQFILGKMKESSGVQLPEKLELAAALLIGSPEFQVH